MVLVSVVALPGSVGRWETGWGACEALAGYPPEWRPSGRLPEVTCGPLGPRSSRHRSLRRTVSALPIGGPINQRAEIVRIAIDQTTLVRFVERLIFGTHRLFVSGDAHSARHRGNFSLSAGSRSRTRRSVGGCPISVRSCQRASIAYASAYLCISVGSQSDCKLAAARNGPRAIFGRPAVSVAYGRDDRRLIRVAAE